MVTKTVLITIALTLGSASSVLSAFHLPAVDGVTEDIEESTLSDATVLDTPILDGSAPESKASDAKLLFAKTSLQLQELQATLSRLYEESPATQSMSADETASWTTDLKELSDQTNELLQKLQQAAIACPTADEDLATFCEIRNTEPEVLVAAKDELLVILHEITELAPLKDASSASVVMSACDEDRIASYVRVARVAASTSSILRAKVTTDVTVNQKKLSRFGKEEDGRFILDSSFRPLRSVKSEPGAVEAMFEETSSEACQSAVDCVTAKLTEAGSDRLELLTSDESGSSFQIRDKKQTLRIFCQEKMTATKPAVDRHLFPRNAEDTAQTLTIRLQK